MNLGKLKKLYSDRGCHQIYVKRLSPNDNSKNQSLLGGSFDLLNIFPITKITTDSSGDWERERFKAIMKFSWIGENGNLYPAPKSQLILYPKYPEVRFSGFLIGCEEPPSDLMTIRLADRLLFLGVSNDGTVIGYVVSPDSELAKEFNSLGGFAEYGVFKIVDLPAAENNKQRLISELKRIHNLDWITSKRLDRERNILPCLSPNCGGYTLEAELGITPNGYSEPDFLGWEVKQFSVSNFDRINSAVITLMTPEPTDGFYVSSGTEAFIRKYGYPDKTGRPDRLNFGGVHKVDVQHSTTNLKMTLEGFDKESGKIRNASGKIVLLDGSGNEAASWSFSSLILHWNRKHNKACYVPSLSEKLPLLKYKYGNKVILGNGTDFQLFLKQMSIGNIYYDPGIKMENASTDRKIKKRSQFRIKSQYLPTLYQNNEVVNVLDT
ncbi:MAG: MvaI/BcnI family restriction endonuclease [Cytophagales bacterium]|nr:MvaI/BcnI family restriction endonuclease [Cytophagales bacterium]